MPFFLKLLFSVMGIHWSHSKNFWNYSFLWPTLEDLIILDYGLRVFNIPKELSPAAKFKAIVQALFTILQSPKSPEGGKSHACGGVSSSTVRAAVGHGHFLYVVPRS